MLTNSSKIYVAGHRGLVGSHVLKLLQKRGYQNLVTATSSEVDLTRQNAVEDFFREQKPEYVFLCAAKVGGILANSTYPAEFIYKNLMIQSHVIHEAYRAGVKRLIFLGSSCIYPKLAKQPLTETALMTAPLEPTNQSYAIAKIAGVEMVRAYNQQYGCHYLSVMPTNLYGPGDNYDLQTSHVMPALIRKMTEAKMRGEKKVTLWGTGEVRREFLYAEDLADALLFLMTLSDDNYLPLTQQNPYPLLNIGVGEDITIKELADLIQTATGFKGDIEWDATKPNGTPRKILDIQRLKELGWKANTSLEEGLKQTICAYL